MKLSRHAMRAAAGTITRVGYALRRWRKQYGPTMRTSKLNWRTRSSMPAKVAFSGHKLKLKRSASALHLPREMPEEFRDNFYSRR
jgi:hypothetical protein